MFPTQRVSNKPYDSPDSPLPSALDSRRLRRVRQLCGELNFVPASAAPPVQRSDGEGSQEPGARGLSVRVSGCGRAGGRVDFVGTNFIQRT